MNLTRGSSGSDVRAAQRKLKAKGHDPGAVDGNFGPKMEEAVRAFQRAQGFAQADGILGDATWARLNS